jgi:AspT/YidE/YbjL antiporter-like protein
MRLSQPLALVARARPLGSRECGEFASSSRRITRDRLARRGRGRRELGQSFFQKYPELAIYLALGIGFAIGGVKLRGFSLGGSTGSLLAGLLIGGLFEVPVATTAKSVLFMLFLFGIGYSVGPKFAKAMKGDGWRFAVLGVFVPVVGLATAWAVATFLHLDAGFAGGLVSGALTESPAIGTASEAIQSLALDAAEKERSSATSRSGTRCATSSAPSA